MNHWRLRLPIVPIPENHGGGEGILLFATAQLTAANAPDGWCKAIVVNDKGSIVQYRIQSSVLLRCMRERMITLSQDREGQAAPDGFLFNADGSVLNPELFKRTAKVMK